MDSLKYWEQLQVGEVFGFNPNSVGDYRKVGPLAWSETGDCIVHTFRSKPLLPLYVCTTRSTLSEVVAHSVATLTYAGEC